MGLVLDQRVYVSALRASRRRAALSYQFDLDALQAFPVACSPSLASIHCPSQPAVALGMDTVINIILLGHFPSQFNLDGFQPLCLALCPAHGSVLCPVLPAISLHVGAVRYAVRPSRLFRGRIPRVFTNNLYLDISISIPGMATSLSSI